MNVPVGIRVAAVALTALVAGCSTDTGGHAAPSAAHSAAHSPSAPAASAASGKRGPKKGSDTERSEVASPVVQCGNHLRMALIMTDTTQPVQAQVATFTADAGPAPPGKSRCSGTSRPGFRLPSRGTASRRAATAGVHLHRVAPSVRSGDRRVAPGFWTIQGARATRRNQRGPSVQPGRSDARWRLKYRCLREGRPPAVAAHRCGGLARESAEAVHAVNAACPTWNLLGFLDDDPALLGRRILGWR